MSRCISNLVANRRLAERTMEAVAPSSRALADRYRAMARSLEGQVWFAGRLADFRYYNMDQAVGRALSLVDKALAPAISRMAA